MVSAFVTFEQLTRNPNGVQRNVLFGDINDYFMDYFNIVNHVVGKTPYTWGGLAERVCSPLVYLLLYPFTFWYDYETNGPYEARADQLANLSFIICVTLSLYFFFYILNKAIKQKEFEKNILMLSFFFSGPMIFNYDRANLTLVAASALFFFLEYYNSDRKALRHFSYIALAVAATMKLFPAVFGVLLFYEKRWKDAVTAIVYGLIIFFVPFFFLEGGINNLPLWIKCVMIHEESYIFRGAYGMLTHTFLNINIAIVFQKMIGYILMIISLAVGAFIKEDWKRCLLITCAILLTSGQQEYYCGIYLFYPVVLFLNQAEVRKEHILFTVLFIVIMAPIQYTISLPPHLLLAERVLTSDVQNMCLIVCYVYLIIQGIIRVTDKVKLTLKKRGEKDGV